MKKLLALLLAMSMVFSLAACGSSGSSSSESTDTSASTEASETPAESAATEESETAEAEEAPEAEATSDFTWNGQKEVWSILPTTGAEGLVQINDAMGAIMESYGFTYVKKDAEGNPGNQVQFVEQAIAAGNVGALMIAAMSVEMLKDVVEQATEAGIAVAYLGAQPTDYTIAGCVYTAYEITGMYAVEAAEYWVQNSGANVPTDANGKYEIAIDTYYDIADGVYRSNAIKGTVESSDILTLVSETTSYGDNALTTAYNNAQTVLNANPDCHLFIAYEPEEAMGIANAIADYCDQTGSSRADYCVVPCYSEDTTFAEMYAAVEADPSANAIKGYATYGDPVLSLSDAEAQLGDFYQPLLTFAQSIDPNTEVIIPTLLTGSHLAECLLTACGLSDAWNSDAIGGYGGTYYDTITAVTVDGFSASWSMGEENPAAQYKN
jgi:ABC-type sugar transport system substrate-binding protein